MVPTNIDSIYTNNSNSGKWVIDEFGDFLEITNTDIPFAHDPETRECLGVLIEPPSRNYFPYCFKMNGGMSSTSGVFPTNTVGANSLLFFPEALFFDGNVKEKSTTFTFDAPQTWFYVGISFFVRFPNSSQPPVYGRSYMEGSDFHFLINGREAIEAGGQVDIKRMNDGSWWVRTRIKTPSRPINDITIGNSYWQNDRDFLIGGLQVEPYLYTSPIITDGTTEERDGNFLSHTAEYNRTMNPQQGTIELGYYLLPGSVGASLYAFRDDNNFWELGHVGEWYDNPEFEPIKHSIRAETEEHSFRYVNDQEDFNLQEWHNPHYVKFTYSAFGYRFTTNESLVYKSKNYNVNELDNPPNNFHFGISKEGFYMNGYITDFNIRGRAQIDEEMIQ